MVGYLELWSGVTGGTVEEEDQLLVWRGAGFGSEVFQSDAHDHGVHPWEEHPDDPTGSGMEEAVDVDPLVLALHHGHRSLPHRCPHPPQHRDQAQARFVLTPHLDGGARMEEAEPAYGSGKPPFLTASWAVWSALWCWGRGTC